MHKIYVNKMRYAITGCLLNVLFPVPVLATSSMSDGTVTMTGSIIETPCAIEMDDRNQIIRMKTLPLHQIARDGYGPEEYFDIRLINCTLERLDSSHPDWRAFAVMFDGPSEGNLFSVSGYAKGVGLQIKDDRGNIALPGIPLLPAKLMEGDLTLHYTTSLVSNYARLRVGEHYTALRFNIVYY